MYDHLYESTIAHFDQSILQFTTLWSFLVRKNIENLDKISSGNPLLNSKPLAQKILPATLFTTKIRKPNASASSLAMAAMDLGNPHLQTVLGKALLKETIEHARLKSLEGLSEEEKKQKIEQLVDKLLVLSVGLLGNQSMQALFPSLGIISDSLTTLPKDSPAFAILFAVSLSNRIQEDVNQGVTTEALQTFLKTNPEFAALPEEDRANLAASLHLGQLIVAGKLLEDNLGLQGLIAQILPSLSPTLEPHLIIPQAEQENKQESVELQTRIKDHFVHQGYSEDKALFLAQTGAELTQEGLLTPHVTSNISSNTINQPLLLNSVKAELVMADYSLEEANTIAHEAIDRTLTDAPYPSTKQFRAALESHLTDLEVKTSTEIAIGAVVIPPAERSLPRVATPPAPPAVEIPPATSRAPAPPAPSQPVAEPTAAPLPVPSQPAAERTAVPLSTPSQPTAESTAAAPLPAPSQPAAEPTAVPLSTPSQPTAESTAAAPLPAPQPAAEPTAVPSSAPVKLSTSELIAILEKRSLQLLVPQLGVQLAKQVTQEIAKSLFGNPDPDSHDVVNLKSPYSLVNVITNQLYHLNIEHNQNWTNAITETYKESIKTMESFYFFLE